MKPINLEEVKLHYDFNDYIDTPVKNLPWVSIKKNSYSDKEFFNIRMDFLALLLGDTSLLKIFENKKNLLKGEMINYNDQDVVSTTIIYYPKHEEIIEYKKDQEPVSVNDFLFENNSITSLFFSFLEKNPDFLQKAPKKYSDFMFSFLFFKQEDFTHIDDIFNIQEMYAEFSNIRINIHDKTIRNMHIRQDDHEYKTFTRSKILLKHFNNIKNNNITPDKKEIHFFNQFLKSFVGNYNYPDNLNSLYNHFNKKDFYSSPDIFKQFTLHFCKSYWDNYNKHHKIETNTDFSFSKFTTFGLFLKDISKKEDAYIKRTLHFLSTISYNHSLFMQINKDILSKIYKELYNNVNNIQGENVVKKVVTDYYSERTILLGHSKIKNDVLFSFLNLFNSMGYKLTFNNYSSYVTKKIMEEKDISILDKKNYLYLCEEVDLNNLYSFDDIRMHSLSSLLYIEDENIFIDILERIKNNTSNFDNDNHFRSKSNSNSYLFNYLFSFYINEKSNLQKHISHRIEECLTFIIQSIPEIKDDNLIGSLKKDKSEEHINNIYTQLEKIKIKASLQKNDDKLIKNKRL